MRKALRKSSVSEDDSVPLHPQDDETDTEQHDSLPHDYDTQHHSSRKKSTGKKSRQNSVDDKKSASTTRQRKSSTSRLKDIVQVAAAKKDLANEHPSGRYKIDKVINTQTQPIEHPKSSKRLEHENEQQVVSERRRSLLRRQGNLVATNRSDIPTIPSESSQEKQNINYEIINERNQEVEQRAKNQKSKLEPEIFRFDRDDIYRNDDISDDDNTSYKEIEFPKVGTSSHESKSQSSNEICWNQNIQDDIMLGIDESETKISVSGSSTPEYATVVKRKPTKPENVPDPKKESSKPIAIDSKSPIEKPKRRFNSFLALVKEAVSTKKQENSHDSADTSVDIQDYEELVTEESESLNSRKGSRKMHAKNKRNDSSSSLWSDNIPVITISKTESDECILEGNSNESTPKVKKNSKSEEGRGSVSQN